jgi:DNA-binding transcriptional MerR regulator
MRTEELTIGELAERTGASVRSLRYYEQQGLLAAQRTRTGHRRFGTGSPETVRRIRLLLDAGLPVAIIAKVMPCFIDGGRAVDACVGAYLDEHLAVMTERISELDRKRGALTELIRAIPR